MNQKNIQEKGIHRKEKKLLFVFSFLILYSLFFILPFAVAQAQSAESSNPNSPGFKLVICDGPAGANINKDPKYIPCDFIGLMKQVQHLINVMIVVGVLVAIAGFSYAGYLYITGIPNNISKAHDIFRKVGVGFIIMLSAWFIVYQILSWLTGNAGFKALLGNP